jgi:monoterpene epsilon-lactone hydrolase
MKRITAIFPPKIACLLLVMSCQAIGSDGKRDRLADRILFHFQNQNRGSIPSSISTGAKEVFSRLWMEAGHSLKVPAVDDTAGFRRMRDSLLITKRKSTEEAIERHQVTTAESTMGGTRVVDLRPKGWREDGRMVILFHAGPHNPDDAFTAAAYGAPLAKASGLRVILVDNTPSPVYNWKEMQRESMNVLLYLKHKGYRMDHMAVCGIGPGGGLAASVVLNMRNHGFGMPAAVLLWSPWAELSENTDSRNSFPEWDPVTPRGQSLDHAIQAYTAGLAISDARVSPANGDFSKGFPPTLVQEGTRSSMLSGSLMLYRALESTGQTVKLDLYEGLFPCFQRFEMEEAERAVDKSASFLRDRLDAKRNPAIAQKRAS